MGAFVQLEPCTMFSNTALLALPILRLVWVVVGGEVVVWCGVLEELRSLRCQRGEKIAKLFWDKGLDCWTEI